MNRRGLTGCMKALKWFTGWKLAALLVWLAIAYAIGFAIGLALAQAF